MSNVTPITSNLPAVAELGAFVRQSDLTTGVAAALAVLSIRQGKFHIKYQKQEIPLTDTLPDGGKVAKTHLDVVLLGVSPQPRRQYYAKPWDPASPPAAPDCYSADGERPSPEVLSPQAANCRNCLKSKYGSKKTERGKLATACPEFKRAAIVPLANLNNEAFNGPVLLNIPPMSVAKLKEMSAVLQHKHGGMPYNCVAIRLGFDSSADYLRLQFTPLRPLTGEELDQIRPHYRTAPGEVDAVSRVLDVKPVEVASVSADPTPAAAAAPTPTPTPTPAPAPAEPVTVVTTEEIEDDIVAGISIMAEAPPMEEAPSQEAPKEPTKRRGRKPRGATAAAAKPQAQAPAPAAQETPAPTVDPDW